MAFEFVNNVVAERKRNGVYRQHSTLEPQVDGITIHHQGKTYLNFSSNDYLGLATPAEVLLNTLENYQLEGFRGVVSGSTGSPLLTGHHRIHQHLEELLSDITGYPAVLLFSSGFAANQGSLQALMNDAQCVQFQDKLNHASLVDAGLTSKGVMQRFAHNDYQHLLQRLASTDASSELHKLIVTEGVFSMDGDQVDLAKLTDIARKNNAWVYLDDAHGFGVLGNDGRGSLAEQQCVVDDVQLYMANFGKAMSSAGAFVATSKNIADYLRQSCRHYIYSTAISPVQALITVINLVRMQKQSWRRELLAERIELFQQLTAEYELPIMPSNTAIQPILLGSSARAVAVSAHLKAHNFWVSAIRPPTVPVNKARLRVSLSANHTAAQIENLVKAIRGAVDSYDFE